MKSSPTVLTTIALGLTVLAVSALAQTPSQPRAEPARDQPSQSPYGPGPGYSYRQSASTNAATRKLQSGENDLQGEANDLVQRLASAKSDAEKKELRGKLETALGKQFDLRQQRHALEIEMLEAKVTRLKQLVNKRHESRSDIIAKRLDQLIRDSEGLGW